MSQCSPLPQASIELLKTIKSGFRARLGNYFSMLTAICHIVPFVQASSRVQTPIASGCTTIVCNCINMDNAFSHCCPLIHALAVALVRTNSCENAFVCTSVIK
eukprot:gnl/MRDRNA2_/MRDRNA2_41813_c0_seq1.p1 gnl/MRDRNA2_/MRDRNA2_41813_c0~~gnl/MRDRNA2_/MRDRNA2_41813_c0_seq1.p1  ORF type:complete len:103 (+),score=5.34 gnl/MRDRNA2_/MRDRNA2_41813_c0_seq1:272-580(+)